MKPNFQKEIRQMPPKTQIEWFDLRKVLYCCVLQKGRFVVGLARIFQNRQNGALQKKCGEMCFALKRPFFFIVRIINNYIKSNVTYSYFNILSTEL